MLMTRTIATTGLIAWLMTSAAHALTADQVWTGWQANLAAFDFTLTPGETAVTGNATTYRNIAFMPTGEEALIIPEITLTEAADGSVTVSLPPELVLVPPPSDNDVTLTLTQQGLAVVITEPTPGARNYAYAADTLKLSIAYSEMVDMFDGSAPKESALDLLLETTALAGTYSDTPGTNRSFVNDFAATSFTMKMDQTDPFFGGNTTQNSVAQNFVLKSTFTMPATFDLTTIDSPLQVETAIRDGLAATLAITQGRSTTEQSTTGSFLNYGVKSATEGGTLNVNFDSKGLAMNGTGEPATFRVTADELPIPFIDVAAGAAAIDIKVPLIGTEMQDFRYMVKIDGLTVNDEAWAMVDPTAILPRTPLFFDIDITGKAAINFLAIIEAEESGAVPPIPQIESLQIPTLLLSGAGAEVTGTGAFTFDNSTGVPMPRGNADVTVKGANKMIDALIAMGVMTTDDAMGARMAMALLLEPSAEPDVGTSKIEARDDNSIYVNGQRMQ